MESDPQINIPMSDSDNHPFEREASQKNPDSEVASRSRLSDDKEIFLKGDHTYNQLFENQGKKEGISDPIKGRLKNNSQEEHAETHPLLSSLLKGSPLRPKSQMHSIMTNLLNPNVDEIEGKTYPTITVVYKTQRETEPVPPSEIQTLYQYVNQESSQVGEKQEQDESVIDIAGYYVSPRAQPVRGNPTVAKLLEWKRASQGQSGGIIAGLLEGGSDRPLYQENPVKQLQVSRHRRKTLAVSYPSASNVFEASSSKESDRYKEGVQVSHDEYLKTKSKESDITAEEYLQMQRAAQALMEMYHNSQQVKTYPVNDFNPSIETEADQFTVSSKLSQLGTEVKIKSYISH
ncbi:hypothetical protein RF11_14160 [Thelohanellus kitauei]|uniref:Uncharacterized protein n=1 Tax=Thelohanellus kitauei TaxID=669202 RepID=A0A0C2MBZ4_THEKT|nr:hypothetical protein RF11_14160 [Thelohanellus kitauei]